MPHEVFNRYEHKYMLDKNTYIKVISVISEHMVLDKYNIDNKPYPISNIYYDTEDDYLIRKSLSKPKYKEKLRLRSYGIPDDDSMVFLEIKKKYNGLVNKRRTVLTLHDAYEMINTGKKPETKEYMNIQVLNEIEYFLKTYSLKPKLYLAYDRIAYYEKDNDDLRISFDTNIRTRRYDIDLKSGDHGERILSEDLYLMEIKTSLALPLWLSNMLTAFNIRRQSFSKYGTEYKKYINSNENNTQIKSIV